MSRRTLQITGIVFLGLSSGCSYDRGVGWRWEPNAVKDGVVDTLFNLIPDNRSAAERAEDDADEFFNAD
jgi:hypothetical protein